MSRGVDLDKLQLCDFAIVNLCWEYYNNSCTLYSANYTLPCNKDTKILRTSAHGSGVVDGVVRLPSTSPSAETVVAQDPYFDKTYKLYSLSNFYTQLKTQLTLRV